MILTQTVEITAKRRTIKVPSEIPAGKVTVTFVTEKVPLHDCSLCAKYRDPMSKGLKPNAETIAAIEETRKPSAKQFNSLEELLVDLRS